MSQSLCNFRSIPIYYITKDMHLILHTSYTPPTPDQPTRRPMTAGSEQEHAPEIDGRPAEPLPDSLQPAVQRAADRARRAAPTRRQHLRHGGLLRRLWEHTDTGGVTDTGRVGARTETGSEHGHGRGRSTDMGGVGARTWAGSEHGHGRGRSTDMGGVGARTWSEHGAMKIQTAKLTNQSMLETMER